MMLIKSSFPQKAKTKIEKKIGPISTEIADKHNIKKLMLQLKCFTKTVHLELLNPLIAMRTQSEKRRSIS